MKKEDFLETIKENGKYQVTVKDEDYESRKMTSFVWEKVRKKWRCILLVLLLTCSAFLISFFIQAKRKTVTNNIVINIEKIQEVARLEVLSVSDSVIIADSPKDNGLGIDAWTQFTGTGVFTVDLQFSEFIVDQVRKTVIVRTPQVVFDPKVFSLEYDNIKELFFHNNWTNDSYKAGVQIANNQMNAAYCEILDTITINPYYYPRAKKAAETLIKALIKSLNKDIEDLRIIVEVGVL